MSKAGWLLPTLGALPAGETKSYTCTMPLVNEACAEGSRDSGSVRVCDSAAFSVDGASGPTPAPGGEPGPEPEGESASQPEPEAAGADRASNWLLLVALALLIGGGLFAWNRMKAG